MIGFPFHNLPSNRLFTFISWFSKSVGIWLFVLSLPKNRISTCKLGLPILNNIWPYILSRSTNRIFTFISVLSILVAVWLLSSVSQSWNYLLDSISDSYILPAVGLKICISRWMYFPVNYEIRIRSTKVECLAVAQKTMQRIGNGLGVGSTFLIFICLANACSGFGGKKVGVKVD